MTSDISQRTTLLYAIFACILWSTSFAVSKVALIYTTPLQLAGFRFMLSGLIILPFCRNLKSEFKIASHSYRKILQISLFQTVILYFFFYLGLNKTPAAVAAIIIGAGPLSVSLLAHFLVENDKLSLRKIIALLIGFSGIVLLAITKDNETGNHRQVFFGIVLLIAGNFAGSYGNILVSQNKTKISPLLLNAIQIFIGGLILFTISLFSEEFSFSLKPLPYYISLAWLGILSAVAFSLWFIVLNHPRVKVSEINVWKFIIPVLGAILSWLIVEGEKPEWYTLIGMLLISTAIVIIYLQRKSRL